MKTPRARDLALLAGAAALAWVGHAGATTVARAYTYGVPIMTAWTLPERANKYLMAITKAETEHGLPGGLLARLLHQESRYRDDIIHGLTVSSAGAVGIAQIVPRWHPNVDPLDPWASIDYAAGYLARLRAQFGSWRLALAAYNWGPGNIGKTGDAPDEWPQETRDYVAEITADTGVA